MRNESLSKMSLSPAGDVLYVHGRLSFQDWSDVLPFAGPSIDLTHASEIDSAGLGMLLCCVQRGQQITGCHTAIRQCMKNGGLCAYCNPATRCVN